MRLRQVVVYEGDGRLAELLRRESRAQGWSIREARRSQTCLGLLRKGQPSALVMKLGRDLADELGLLDRVTWLFPETAAIVIGGLAGSALSGLVWDLGASVVLPSAPPGRELSELVGGFLTLPEISSSLSAERNAASTSGPFGSRHNEP
jgi:DNA-binding response OmpR family regulator